MSNTPADGRNGHRKPILHIAGLTKRYGRGDTAVTAVDDVSLEIYPGEVVGLLGANGAGKTTLIKSMLGLIVPDRGEISIDGADPRDDPKAVYQSVAAMLEGARNTYWRLTVRENLRFFAAIGGHEPNVRAERHGQLLDRFGLTDRATTVVNELSRGMKGKVSLAVALARDTPLILLDEPTLGLDVESSRELQAEIRRLAEAENRTVVVSSHDLDVIEAICDRVIILRDGRIIADEAIEELMRVFKRRQYRFDLRPTPPANIREQLENDIDLRRWDVHADGAVVEVVLDRPMQLYDVIDLFREGALEITEAESVNPRLEDVFLEMIAAAPDQTAEIPTREAR